MDFLVGRRAKCDGENVSLNEEYVSRGRIATGAAWLLAFLALSVGWLFFWTGWLGDEVLIMCAATTGFCAALAAALQVRTYMVRMAALIRSTIGLERPGNAGSVHSIR